jgi:UDP-N-acetylglucosamine--N-acetylmuramyl-(pentapeptide) pyrophosphoryl-undecaprenol N-acetylglucosamine transferase
LKVLFTCGGTAGHINPAIAAANLLKSRHPEAEILFVGAQRGMENELVPREGYPLKTVEVMRFQRSFSWFAIRYNARTLYQLPRSKRQARQILREFKPDLVVGTGGYASYPVVREAARQKIPTAIHESNAVPGLTTKMLAKVADRVMVGFEDSRRHYSRPGRVVVTGTPVRGDFFARTRAEARRELGLAGSRPLVLSYFGSLGARDMNRKMAEFIRLECQTDPFYHIHGAGNAGFQWMPGLIRSLGVDLEQHPAVQVKEYIYNMALIMAAADLIICRAGASTISEVTALSKPAILIPSPNVTGNHQEKNARVLERRGAAIVIPEAECSGARLFETASGILTDETRLMEMKQASGAVSAPDAAERMYQVMMELLRV